MEAMTGQGRDDFAHLLWAEWTKFRSVRGWVIPHAVGCRLRPRQPGRRAARHHLERRSVGRTFGAGVKLSICEPHNDFPLAPWTGFAVSCARAAAALGLAVYLLRRRDA
jgi:hypothetical protein